MIGITALVPAEVIYSCGEAALDLNNFVPNSKLEPEEKLCAWTAIWRELVLRGEVKIDKLVVVAGGDCYNALVEGEKVELAGKPTHYFTYPFDGDSKVMQEELNALAEFLGGIKEEAFDEVAELKKLALEIHEMRCNGEVGAEKGFLIEVSGSDLMGSLEKYRSAIEEVKEEEVDYEYRVALLGIPPIYPDFHAFLQEVGMHVVFDEMPFEFIRHSGKNLKEVARSYANYTFAGHIKHRLRFLESQLRRHRVDAIIHFQQFACHHKLEDRILRDYLYEKLGYPYMTIEADLPSPTPQQARLRLEAFAERLREVW
jgi:benzoyl-CoA reductase/2-hydroxyglutaryl-CoA dehydratase subunit BcrC/BadD/HgdB